MPLSGIMQASEQWASIQLEDLTMSMKITTKVAQRVTSATPNRQGYYLTASGMRRVRAAAKFAGLEWQAIAARPNSVYEFLMAVEPDMDSQLEDRK